MDSGVASDDEKRNQRTKEQKQKLNEQQQIFNGCFIDATSLGDDNERLVPAPAMAADTPRWSDERRQGALVFQSSIQQYSTLHTPPPSHLPLDEVHMQEEETSDCTGPTPHNSLINPECAEKTKSPVGFYVDFTQLAPPATHTTHPPPTNDNNQKKNIFSMVIDFDAPKKREMPTRLSTSLQARTRDRHDTPTTNGDSAHAHTSSSGADDADKHSLTAANMRKNSGDGDSGSTSQHYVKLSDLKEQLPRVDRLTFAPRMSRSSIPTRTPLEPCAAMAESAHVARAHPIEPMSDDASPPPRPSHTQRRRCAQRLGTDLLRMFLEEIGADVTIHVGKRKIHAHRCILVSRCQYFAAALGADWPQGGAQPIRLDRYTYACVHFALCHIYSGAAHIPDTINVMELAALADLLCLEGLKEVVIDALKTRHCHHFHPPCAGCIHGVLEVLPLSAAYGLDDLYHACLQWIRAHTVHVWPTRPFATLLKELRDKCYRQHVLHMTVDHLLPTIADCDQLMASVSTAKWAEPVLQLVLKLADYCQTYLKQHYAAVVGGAHASRALDQAASRDRVRVYETCLVAAACDLSPDQAVRAYVKVRKLQAEYTGGGGTSRFATLLKQVAGNVDQCLLGQMAHVVQCKSWKSVDLMTKKRIRELATPTTNTVTPALARRTATRTTSASESSSSSRHSSPIAGRGAKVAGGGAGAAVNAAAARNRSPNLRRSLLLAARTTSPPTRTMAARMTVSAPAPPVRRAAPTAQRASTLTQPTKSSVAKVAVRSPTPPSPRKTIAPRVRATQAQLQRTDATKSSKLPTRQAHARANASSSVGKRVGVAAVAAMPAASPPTAMKRSGTFLKEEPTVLGKLQ